MTENSENLARSAVVLLAATYSAIHCGVWEWAMALFAS